MSQVPVIAIDGPSGSGKGTIARQVARHFGWHLLDSGALYRLVALAGMRAGLAADDVEGHAPVGREPRCQLRHGRRRAGSSCGLRART